MNEDYETGANALSLSRGIKLNKTERICHRTQSNEIGRHRTIKFDVVRSSNEIEQLTFFVSLISEPNRTKSKFSVRFSSIKFGNRTCS